jgi:hypothetical protein
MEDQTMKYHVYGVNSMGSTWYLSKPGAQRCDLWTGAPKELRATFDTKEAARAECQRLDDVFRFGSTRHFVQEVSA